MERVLGCNGPQMPSDGPPAGWPMAFIIACLVIFAIELLVIVATFAHPLRSKEGTFVQVEQTGNETRHRGRIVFRSV